MEHIEKICSLGSRLFFISICSIRIRSRKLDIFEKPLRYISNPYVLVNTGRFPTPVYPEGHLPARAKKSKEGWQRQSQLLTDLLLYEGHPVAQSRTTDQQIPRS